VSEVVAEVLEFLEFPELDLSKFCADSAAEFESETVSGPLEVLPLLSLLDSFGALGLAEFLAEFVPEFVAEFPAEFGAKLALETETDCVTETATGGDVLSLRLSARCCTLATSGGSACASRPGLGLACRLGLSAAAAATSGRSGTEARPACWPHTLATSRPTSASPNRPLGLPPAANNLQLEGRILAARTSASAVAPALCLLKYSL